MKTMKRKREQVSERVRVVVSGQNENRGRSNIAFFTCTTKMPNSEKQ
jgi:hypothetical protein